MTGKFDVPRFGTINDCAKMTSLSKFHVRQLVRQNKVKYIRAGTKYLVNINSLIDYFNQGDNPETSTASNFQRKDDK